MRRFRFFQWNDFHIRNLAVIGRSTGYPDCNDKAAWATACARGEIDDIEPPDFIASVGDLICGEIDDYEDDFRFLDEHLLAVIDMPLLPCLGNHENRQGEGIVEQNIAYDHFYGHGWHNYIYTIAGVAFIVVDTSGGHRPPDDITASRNAFVARAFERIGAMPAFLLTHVPLIPMRRPETLQPSFGFSSWKVLDDTLLHIVEAHSKQLIGVLSGHIHLTSVVEHAGVHHITPSGTAGHPADFAAIDVYDDHVHVQMIAAPGTRTGDRTGNLARGDIHGARRHGIDYTDIEHPDHDSYLHGNADERQFTIYLQPSRQPQAEAASPLRIEHESELGSGRKSGPGQWVEAQL